LRTQNVDVAIDGKHFASKGKRIALRINGKKVFSTEDLCPSANFKIEDVEWESLESFLQTASSAFGHIDRFRIVKFLSKSPKSFTEIKKLLEVTSPTVNFHLKALMDGTVIFKNEARKYALTLMGELLLDYFADFLKEANSLQNELYQQEVNVNK
jgi:DNA-binding HxlR family transcriptional regulator